jgi:hypothetical protein
MKIATPAPQLCFSCGGEAATSSNNTVPLCGGCAALVTDRRGVRYEPAPSPPDSSALEAQIASYLRAAEASSDGSAAFTEIESTFNSCVDFLRLKFPNTVINKLMGVVRDVAEQRVAPMCLDLRAPTLSFYVAGLRCAPQAMIATPANWVSLVRHDPITQLGLLVFVGSQAADYMNERFEQRRVLPRAKAYQAEFLNTVRSLTPSWKPERLQAEVLDEFPDGVLTPKAHKILYSLQPLAPSCVNAYGDDALRSD